jgi:integron integrase
MTSEQIVDQLRASLRTRHYSIRTEKTYVHWTRRFLRFCGGSPVSDLGPSDVARFLTHLAVERNVAASTQNQALNAIVYVFKAVLKRELGDIGEVVRAKRPETLPLVLRRDEVQAVLDHIEGAHGLMAGLLYGSGLRLTECLRLRVKDLEFGYRQVIVRNGKGEKDRVTILPEAIREPIGAHLQEVKSLHERDLAEGYGSVYLPYALARKYPNAGRRWCWQYVFPADKLSTDPRSGVVRRHHEHEKRLQRRRGCNGRWLAASKRRASRNRPRPIHFDIRSPPTYSKTATISARYRSYSAIRIWPRR